MTPKITLTPVREELRQELLELDSRAEELGAEHVRSSIKFAIADLSESAGAENARAVIAISRRALQDRMERGSHTGLSSTSPPPASSLDFDEVVA